MGRIKLSTVANYFNFKLFYCFSVAVPRSHVMCVVYIKTSCLEVTLSILQQEYR